jgi:hypothetical protein
MKMKSWHYPMLFTVFAVAAMIFADLFWATPSGGLSPYGNPFGPHELIYPCAGWTPNVPFGQSPTQCPGLHGGPCIPDSRGAGCGDPYPGPSPFSTDPFTVMIQFRSYYPRPPATRYQAGGGYLPDYAYNAFNDREPEIDAGCLVPQPPDGNGRVGCTYPHAWYSWDFIEPPVQAILLQIQNVIANDPGFQIKCSESRDDWFLEFYGHPYAGPDVCPTPTTPTVTPPPTPPTPTPTPPPAACPPAAICLGPAGRFQVTVAWTAPPNQSGNGNPIPLSVDTGAFWFFTAGNYELVVKVLNGTTINGKWWVFYGALSNVQYVITVTDSLTHAIVTYTNPQGTMASVGDTTAFPGGGGGFKPPPLALAITPRHPDATPPPTRAPTKKATP